MHFKHVSAKIQPFVIMVLSSSARQHFSWGPCTLATFLTTWHFCKMLGTRAC